VEIIGGKNGRSIGGILRDHSRIMEEFTGNHKRLWGILGDFTKTPPLPS